MLFDFVRRIDIEVKETKNISATKKLEMLLDELNRDRYRKTHIL